MKEEELPEYLQNALCNLIDSSQTICLGVEDALISANCVEDFQENVSNAMNNLIDEAKCVKMMVVGKKDEEPPVSGELTVDEAKQIAFETLRYVAIMPDWANFKDLVGRELDVTDEVLDHAVELLFSDKNDHSSLKENGLDKNIKIGELQRLIDMYYVAEEDITAGLVKLINFGKECDCGDRVVFKQIVEGDFDYILETCIVCGGNIER